MSRRLSNLSAAILASEWSPTLQQCLLAERAIYFGRKGSNELARADLIEIERISHIPDIRVSAMRNISLGVIDFYCADGNQSIDKATRAYSLASAGGLTRERALSAAWLSHFFDVRHDVKSACKFAAEALALALPNAHDIRARAGLVVAQNLGIAGRPDLAAAWYSDVLLHANAIGDELTISALIFNRSVARVSCWRQSRLQFNQDCVQASVEFAAAASAADFDVMIENHGLENLNPLLLAQIFSLRNSYKEASGIYSVYLPKEDYALRMQAEFVADHAVCLYHLGREAEARATMDIAISKLISDTHPDDRAATFSRAANLYRELGDKELSKHYAAVAIALWEEYSKLQVKMVEMFAEIPLESYSK